MKKTHDDQSKKADGEGNLTGISFHLEGKSTQNSHKPKKFLTIYINRNQNDELYGRVLAAGYFSNPPPSLRGRVVEKRGGSISKKKKSL